MLDTNTVGFVTGLYIVSLVALVVIKLAVLYLLTTTAKF